MGWAWNLEVRWIMPHFHLSVDVPGVPGSPCCLLTEGSVKSQAAIKP